MSDINYNQEKINQFLADCNVKETGSRKKPYAYIERPWQRIERPWKRITRPWEPVERPWQNYKAPWTSARYKCPHMIKKNDTEAPSKGFVAGIIDKIKKLDARWAGKVDFELVKIMVIRYLRAPIVFGLLNRIAEDTYEIRDRFGDMENMTSEKRDEFYRKFTSSKKDEISYNWKKFEISYQNAVPLISANFIVNDGAAGKLLTRSANVYVSGEIEIKREYARNREERFRYRNVDTKWIWIDDVDANSFPGIATLKGESKNVYQNVDMDFWGILSATLEGYADYMETFIKTDFKVEIRWEDKNESVSKPFAEEKK